MILQLQSPRRALVAPEEAKDAGQQPALLCFFGRSIDLNHLCKVLHRWVKEEPGSCPVVCVLRDHEQCHAIVCTIDYNSTFHRL